MKTRLLSQLRLVSKIPNASRAATPQTWTRCNSTVPRTYSTPLAKQLTEAIKATGPIPIASYMRQCLTSDSGGYYTAKGRNHDPFGRHGDFITSPEISQLFGEMLGVWIVAEWMQQGRKGSGVQLVELGPGRGTLMDDVLRTLQSFKPLSSALETIILIEASPSLRNAQKTLLCGESATFKDIKNGQQCNSKYFNIPIVWYEHISFIPQQPRKSPFILAHEFFDALPIHAFISTDVGWRELLVGPLDPPLNTPTSSTPVPEFALTTSKTPTPHSLYLPYISPRYKPLSKPPGNTIEISPESLSTITTLSQTLGDRYKSGAILIIDYGTSDTIPTNSLRGIKTHQRVSPFLTPGMVDISADVDFLALAETAIAASQGVEVYGPIEQGVFLKMMGIEERMGVLLKAAADAGKRDDGNGEKIKKRIEVLKSGCGRLVDRGVQGMGRLYKVMAVVPERGGKRPVGFGGEVE